MAGARAAVVIAVVLSGALAGCFGGEPEEATALDPSERDASTLAAGRGAIAGLVIDDRFRPIPGTRILIPELGRTAASDADGEFAFRDVPPGRYTLKVSADGHEARTHDVGVSAGAYAELEIIARRVVDRSGSMITQEYSVFIACSAGFVANGINAPCALDLGDETYSSFFISNLTTVPNITYLVTEFKAAREGAYRIQVRSPTPNGTELYAIREIEGDYMKIVNRLGVKNEEHNDPTSLRENVPWNNTYPFQTIFFVDHPHRQTVQDAWPDPGVDEFPSPPCCGLGFQAGIKARFVQTVFIGEPDVDIRTYRSFG